MNTSVVRYRDFQWEQESVKAGQTYMFELATTLGWKPHELKVRYWQHAGLKFGKLTRLGSHGGVIHLEETIA